MLNELKTIKEIIDFFKDLVKDVDTNPSYKLDLTRIYHMALNWQEKLEIDNKIKSLFDEKDIFGMTRNPVKKITIINDDITIVETKEIWNKKKETYFYAVVNGQKYFECSKTFDYALVLALSIKYGEEKCAPKMIYNMLNMYKFELMDELK